jgi:hypothetical protein
VLPEVPAALAVVIRPAPPAEGTLRTAGGAVDRTLPGGDFIARTTWREVLEPAGWTVAGHRDRVTYWRRPGKVDGVSATTGYVGADALFIFSSNAAPFEAGRSYTRFGAYAGLEHQGDLSAAAGELRRRGYGQVAGPAADAVDPERPDFWAARRVLAHVRDFALARRASPWAVLGVVLARMVTATPPRVVLPPLVGGDVSLNLFAGLVGPSGAGKDAALRAAADAVDFGPVTTAGPGSGEGLGHLFMRRERDGSLTQHTVAVLLVAPEVDTLTALGWQRRGATLLAELRKAYMGDELGFAYADPAKRLRVPAHGYRLGLVVGIQPGRAGELLGDADAGTPQRFVWLPAADPGAPEVAPPAPATWTWSPRHWGVASAPWAVVPGRFRLEVCGSARRAVDAARLAGLREEDVGLDSHAALARLKVAAALALLDGRAEVGEADWHLAEVVLTVSDATRARVAEVLAAQAATANRRRAEAEGARTVIVAEHVAEANLQRVTRKVSRILAREGGELAHAVLRRSMTSADRPYLEEAIGRLVDAGQVATDSTPSGHGQPGVRYRLRT